MASNIASRVWRGTVGAYCARCSGMRRADQVRSAPEAVANPEYEQFEQRRARYQKARGACLTARGSTVE
jgi:hypothetical protein